MVAREDERLKESLTDMQGHLKVNGWVTVDDDMFWLLCKSKWLCGGCQGVGVAFVRMVNISVAARQVSINLVHGEEFFYDNAHFATEDNSIATKI